MRDRSYKIQDSYYINTKNIIIQGQQLVIRETARVFRPARPSFLLAENIKIKSGDRVCDIGTGCGLFAILSAKLGASISYGIDILKDCISLSRLNAYLNQVSKICRFKQGNLFEPTGSMQFDVVISNPPQTPRMYLKGIERGGNFNDNIYVALDGGEDGIELPIRIVSEAIFHLVRGGRLYLLVLKWHRWKEIITAMHKHFSSVDEVCCESVPLNNLSPSFLKNADLYPNRFFNELFKDGLNIGIYEAIK